MTDSFEWLPTAQKHIGFVTDPTMFPPEGFPADGHTLDLNQWDALQAYEHWLLTTEAGGTRLRHLQEARHD